MNVRTRTWMMLMICAALGGCSIGPRALDVNRLRYNEAIKKTTEEQLLLNIVRLRYIDTPSSLSVTSIATQHEIVKSLGLTPFFGASQNFQVGPFSTILPSANVNTADRPTISLTPQDDQDFTKRLFTPIPLDGVVYLSKTTWPISTVFRLWLENINWVSNAETASGPTPKTPPVYAEFRNGMEALQRLQDHGVVRLWSEEAEEKISEGLPSARISGADLLSAAKEGYEFRKDEKKDSWVLIKKHKEPHLRVNTKHLADPDFKTFCHAFHLDPTLTKFDLVADKADPFLAKEPKSGMKYLDLETRSLLQVLFFMAHGVSVPTEHVATGKAPLTINPDGGEFDWQEVLGELFQVHSCKSHHRPPFAAVAIRYHDYWFYIDERDRDSKSTFALIMELSRLELAGKSGSSAPVLTLPIGGR